MKQNNKLPDLVFHYKQTSSTMNDADKILDNVRPLPDEFIILADKQTGGMGRNNNTWISQEGGLWFTYCMKVSQVTQQVTLLLGLSLLQSLSRQYPFLRDGLKIKWPNDLLFKDNKLAGILVKTRNDYLCIGIGINTNNEPDALNFNFNPVSLKLLLGFEVSNDAILGCFLKNFRALYAIYIDKGIRHFREEINQNLFAMGRDIIFNTGESVIEGKCLGISDEGTLTLESAFGGICRCYSGSISAIKA